MQRHIVLVRVFLICSKRRVSNMQERYRIFRTRFRRGRTVVYWRDRLTGNVFTTAYAPLAGRYR